MTLMAGARLGAYEILALLGAGGMGEVYKAKDTRLNRTVAIKVLPQHLRADPDLKQRFEREAQAVAALEHPHICVLHDIGHDSGIDFLVLEHLEGDTLAERLAKGPLPVDQVMRHAIEIADALDKAHRKGIIHRDLKPGNVMLTKSGVKLLDFGLAKFQQAATVAGMSVAATVNDPLTGRGTILGTLHYMAPEQLEGKEADARSDIFAFGAIVYEMATGRRAFAGKSHASLIANILEHDPPPLSSIQPMTPAALEHVVKRCLAKDPDDRWQTARDLGVELKWVAGSGSQIGPLTTVPATGVRAPGRPQALLSLAALLLGSTVAGLGTWTLMRAPSTLPQPVARFTMTLPPGDRLVGPGVNVSPSVAFSRDGRFIAYVATRGGTGQIFLRALHNAEATPMRGTEGAGGPFFSPDAQWLAFNTAGTQKKIPLTGGAAVSLGIAGLGSAWTTRGTIVFGGPEGLQEVSDSGGTPHALTRREQGEPTHREPELLPGGDAVVFVAGTPSKIVVLPFKTGQRRDLIPAGASPRYVAGHLVYAQSGTLFAVPFDAERLEVTGGPVPLIEDVLQSPNGTAHYDVSATGSLVYLSGPSGPAAPRRLVWIARNGAEQPLSAPPREFDWPRISPDGKRVAVEVGSQTWIYDLDRDTLTRFAFEGSQNDAPAWTPDGKRIAFRSNREGPSRIYWQMADGSGGLERLTSESGVPRSWSGDGQLLAFHSLAPGTQRDIWVLSLSDRKERLFLRTPFTEGAAAFSPDGRWLAYVSDESGRPEIYVKPYPRPGGKWQISPDGGTEPVWNRNGRELFYRSENRMIAVPVETGTSFSAGKPAVLFEGEYLSSVFPLVSVAYDVSADGQRFLMVKEAEQPRAPTQMNVVLNWVEELKRRVPAGR